MKRSDGMRIGNDWDEVIGEEFSKDYYLALEVRTDKYETVAFKMNFTDGSYGIVTLQNQKKDKNGFAPYAMPVRLCKPIQ